MDGGVMERLVYEDTDKRIYVTEEATDDFGGCRDTGPPVEVSPTEGPLSHCPFIVTILDYC